MRAGCFDCMFKHLGQAAVWVYTQRFEPYPLVRAQTCLAKAMVLQGEMHLGYPQHLGLFVGHLACASEELVGVNPSLALDIRKLRLRAYNQQLAGDPVVVDLEPAIRELGTGPNLSEEAPRWTEADYIQVRKAKVLGHLSEAAEEALEASPDMAARICTMVVEWTNFMLGDEEPNLKFEDLFDSLLNMAKNA